MKFYTTEIDREFFDIYIKSEIPTQVTFTRDVLQCYAIECIIPAVVEGEIWICDTQDDGLFYPVILYKRVEHIKTEYAYDDFMKIIPEKEVKDICDYIEMVKYN